MATEYNNDMPTLEMTLEEFLEWEAAEETKHEWVDGHVFDFAGATNRHIAIAVNLAVKIAPHVRPCLTTVSDGMIRMRRSARYADLAVSCDERDTLESRTVRYPKLVVEVLSESTARIDRSEKLDEYTGIETLEEYVLVDSRKRWVQVVRRADSGWNMSSPLTDGKLTLASIDLEIDLDDLYASVRL
jgi:Uma2 family endonuclease